MPNPQQIKKLQKLAKILDGGDVALLTELDALESRIDEVAAQIPALKQAVDGEKGERGEKGEKGDRGERGERGPAGRDGKDSTVPGPKGDKGEPGESIVGPAGKDGKDGIDGFIDEATIAYLENEIKRVEDKIPDGTSGGHTNFGFVIRDVVAGSGVTVDKSDPQRPVINASGNSWINYVSDGLFTGTTTTIADGDVLTYSYNGATIYRHITTAVDAYGYPTEDAFYSTFVNPTLSGLIVARG